MTVLHIIEPNLHDYRGHYYALLSCLLPAGEKMGFKLHVWTGVSATGVLKGFSCRHYPYFFSENIPHVTSHLRKAQKFALYERLFLRKEICFIPSASIDDIIMLHEVAKNKTKSSKFVFGFHSLRLKQENQRAAKKISASPAELPILTTTDALRDEFIRMGYNLCLTAPYPFNLNPNLSRNKTIPFRGVLYAGAATLAKGFTFVVDLVNYLAKKGSTIPILIHGIPPRNGYEEKVAIAIKHLNGIRYPYLEIHTEPIPPDLFRAHCSGRLCLLLYDEKQYRFRLSGIAIDAFCEGSPIIATRNTWMGNLIEKYGCGIVVKEAEASRVHNAIHCIMDDYTAYSKRAFDTAITLQRRHDPVNIFNAIRQLLHD